LAFAVQGFTKLPSTPWLARNRVVMLAVSVSGIARKRLLEPVLGNLNDTVRSEEEMCRYTLRVQCADRPPHPHAIRLWPRTIDRFYMCYFIFIDVPPRS
jgi:tRNA G37 N-methylase Trm5